MLPLHYELPETIANPRAPQPIGAILPKVLERYGISLDSIQLRGTATEKDNARRQNGPLQSSSKDWRTGRDRSEARRNRKVQLSLFSKNDSVVGQKSSRGDTSK